MSGKEIINLLTNKIAVKTAPDGNFLFVSGFQFGILSFVYDNIAKPLILTIRNFVMSLA